MLNKRRKNFWLVILLFLIVAAGFLLTSIFSYLVTKNYVINSATTQTLPLLSDNIYSGIKQDLADPINISSLMANDTFLINWVTSGERDLIEITEYLSYIKEKYGFTSTFFVSEQTSHYYYSDGVLKHISPADDHDVWYYTFKELDQPYALDVDTDEAKNGTLTVFINHRLEQPDGTFLGVTGVGIELGNIAEKFKEYQDRYQHEIILVDQNGLVQIHSERDLVETTFINELMQINPADTALFSTDDEVKIREVMQEDGPSMVSIRYIKEFGWYLVIANHESDALKEARRSLLNNIWIGAIITLVVSSIIIAIFRAYNQRLETLAALDGLTEVYNRRFFMEILQRELTVADRYRQPLSLMMIDIDDFKSVNDQFGHLVGDECIKSMVRVMKETLRASDMIGRWGGDEFVVLLMNASSAEAEHTARRILDAVESHPLQAAGETIHRTVSIGLSTYTFDDPTGTRLIQHADDALLTAKDLGRNTIAKG